MSRLVAPRFVLQNCRNVYKGIFAKYSVDTGSKEHIDRLIKGKKVVVFMKGIPEEPRCGFSRLVILILNAHGVKDFEYYDVLEDEKLRKGIKDYSNWPTIPQVYIGEEFMGGCDVMQDMHKTGELIEELKKVGIRSALLDREDSDEKS